MRFQTSLSTSLSALPRLLPILLAATTAACTASTSSSESQPPGQPPAQAKSDLARTAESSVPAADLSAAVAANNAFAVDLFAQLRAGASQSNLFTSPLSASLALTMTYAGAQGPTATEMAKALHLGTDASAIFQGQNALDQALESRAAAALAQDAQSAKSADQAAPAASDYDLHVVNSIWGEKTYPWAQPFLDTMATDYGTGIYLEDFVHQADQARVAINGWVSEQTADRINNLLPQGSIDDSTRMVLVNAVHLKLPWEYPFTASLTQSGTFTRGDGSKVSVPMMNGSQTFGYVDDGKAQIVALPLSGQDVNVIIAVPHGDLASYEANLAAGSAALTVPTGEQEVTLSLPKVSLTSSPFSLKAALQAMGMEQAFLPTAADFSGLCAKTPDGERLYVGDVLQETMLGMQETGVEAAAATAVVVGTAAALDPVTVTVDRPFLVSIVDSSGAILFLGHIEDPTQTQ